MDENKTYFNFYSNKKRKYLSKGYKPTLIRGSDFVSIDELWAECEEILNNFNKELYKKYENDILEIVNYKFTSLNKYFALSCYLAEYFANGEFTDDYKSVNGDIASFLAPKEYITTKHILSLDIELLIFIKVYYTELIYNLYEEELGGPSKLRSMDTDIYMNLLEKAYFNLIKLKDTL